MKAIVVRCQLEEAQMVFLAILRSHECCVRLEIDEKSMDQWQFALLLLKHEQT